MVQNENQKISLEIFLSGRLNQMKREYVRAINRNLSQHLYAGTLARNILAIVKCLVNDLNSAILSGHLECGTEQNCLNESDLTAINSIINEFTQAALQHNRTSCALSNFGREHSPDQVYLNKISAGIAELIKILRKL